MKIIYVDKLEGENELKTKNKEISKQQKMEEIQSKWLNHTQKGGKHTQVYITLNLGIKETGNQLS